MALEIDGLTRQFGDLVVLDRVGFRVGEGEVLGIVGPNGAGKTTLIETLCGLQSADGGEVRWHGAPLPPRRRKEVMFYVPDGIAPFAEHPVSAVLDFFRKVYRQPDSVREEAIAHLSLAPVLGKAVGTLSKGYRRRLLVALGLITPHPILIMDEPFDGFDLRQTREMMTLMRRVAAGGRSLVLSIHQLIDAERMCDRFLLLSAGQVRGEGRLDELTSKAGVVGGGLEEVFLALS